MTQEKVLDALYVIMLLLLLYFLLSGCSTAPVAKIQCEAGPAWIGGHRLVFCSDGSVRWTAPDLKDADDDMRNVIRPQRL